MSRRLLRGVTLVSMLAWFASGTEPIAAALHVAEHHHSHPSAAHHGEASGRPLTVGHSHAHGHGHGHDLPEVTPGVRGDTRTSPASSSGGAVSERVTLDERGETAAGVVSPLAPDPRPPQAPFILLL